MAAEGLRGYEILPALAVFSKKITLLSVRKLSFQIDAKPSIHKIISFTKKNVLFIGI